ncbi:MAG: hypothetical protein FJ020_09660 [Chloroflexi bacterium]|nr:hypothetical protein [Chloroflexota bacterium]
MRGTSTVGRRIIGAVVGLLAGGLALGVLAAFLVLRYDDSDDPDYALLGLIFFGGLGLLIGAVLGAAGGATFAQKLSNQTSSFWRALLGAMVGMVAGIPCVLSTIGIPVMPILIVAGAVRGSGWGAKPAKAAGSLV